MTRKGILLPEHEAFVADASWDFIKDKAPRWMPKWVSMQGVLFLVRSIDNLILHRMPKNIKVVLIPFMDAAFKGKVEEMRRLAADVVVGLVDWKGVTKDTQLYVYDSGTRLVVSLVMAFAEKREAVKNVEASYS